MEKEAEPRTAYPVLRSTLRYLRGARGAGTVSSGRGGRDGAGPGPRGGRAGGGTHHPPASEGLFHRMGCVARCSEPRKPGRLFIVGAL